VQIQVVLDRLPVSKSNTYVVSTAGRPHLALSRAARQFQEQVVALLRPLVARQGSFPGEVVVEVEVTYPRYTKDGRMRKRVPDVDGGLKAILDAGTIVGLYADDRQVVRVEAVRIPGDRAQTTITFTEEGGGAQV